MHLIFERYLERLNRLRRDPLTIRNSSQALRKVQSVMDEWNLDPSTVTKLEMEELFSSLLSEYAVSTVALYLRVTRAAYSYAVKLDTITSDPTSEVKLPKQQDVEPETLTNAELRAILRNVANDREYLLFHLLAYTGLRKHEVKNLKWEDVDLQNAQLKIVGKGGKLRHVPIHPALAEVLSETPRECAFVLTTNRGERIGDTSFYRTLEGMLTRAGIQKTQPAHVFRKTVATVLYEEGVQPDTIDKIMGWAPSTVRTKFYTRIPDTSLQAAILKLYSSDPIMEVSHAA